MARRVDAAALRAWTLTLVMVSVTLAGCAGDADPSGIRSTDDAAGPAEVTHTTGGIEGQVLDDEARPVVAAVVELVKTGNTTKTDAQGRYSFSNLDPGTFELRITRGGYEGEGRTVQVVAGQVAQANVILTLLAFDVPYSELQLFEGHIMVGSALVDLVTTGTGYGCEVCRFWFNATPGIEMIVLEVDAELTADVPTDDNDFFFELVGETKGGRYLADYWQIGDQRRVQGGFPDDGDAMQLSNYCSIFTVCVDQRYTLYVTNFYFQPALEHYTALPEQ